MLGGLLSSVTGTGVGHCGKAAGRFEVDHIIPLSEDSGGAFQLGEPTDAMPTLPLRQDNPRPWR